MALTLGDKACLLTCYYKPTLMAEAAQICTDPEKLIRGGYLELIPEGGVEYLRTTRKCEVLCEAIRSIPEPVAVWSIPSKQ